jgi:hypothetical protein
VNNGRKSRAASITSSGAAMLYERYDKPPLTRRAFLRRMLRHLGAAGVLVLVSLAIGMLGFERFQGMPWADAFMNASLFLGGLGPLVPPDTTGGKLFVGVFSLYSGLVFVVVITIVVAPVLHRVLHRFHWDEKD